MRQHQFYIVELGPNLAEFEFHMAVLGIHMVELGHYQMQEIGFCKALIEVDIADIVGDLETLQGENI